MVRPSAGSWFFSAVASLLHAAEQRDPPHREKSCNVVSREASSKHPSAPRNANWLLL